MIDHFAGQDLALRVLANRGIRILGLPLTMTATGKYRYPLQTMQPGQFFLVPNRKGRTTAQTNNSVTSSVGHARRKTGWQMSLTYSGLIWTLCVR